MVEKHGEKVDRNSQRHSKTDHYLVTFETSQRELLTLFAVFIVDLKRRGGLQSMCDVRKLHAYLSAKLFMPIMINP